jgi:hypothetical protein
LSSLLREFLGRQSSGGIDLDHAVPHPGPGRRSRPSIPRRNAPSGIARLKFAGRIVTDEQVPPRRSLADIEILENERQRSHTGPHDWIASHRLNTGERRLRDVAPSLPPTNAKRLRKGAKRRSNPTSSRVAWIASLRSQ